MIANGESGPAIPAFDEAYGALIDTCAPTAGSPNQCRPCPSTRSQGPREVPAGPTILTAEATGEEVHEIIIARINDDVTLTLEELLALPEEESDTMVTFTGGCLGCSPAPVKRQSSISHPAGTWPSASSPKAPRLGFEQMMAAEEAAAGSIPDGRPRRSGR